MKRLVWRSGRQEVAMLQVAAPIWNKIAKQGELQTKFAKRMFPLDQEQLTRAMELEGQKLGSQGFHPTVIRAFQELGPLVAERKAISRFVETNPHLREALPEIQNLNE